MGQGTLDIIVKGLAAATLVGTIAGCDILNSDPELPPRLETRTVSASAETGSSTSEDPINTTDADAPAKLRTIVSQSAGTDGDLASTKIADASDGSGDALQPDSVDDSLPDVKGGVCGKRVAIVGGSYAVHYLAKFLRSKEYCGSDTLFVDRDPRDPEHPEVPPDQKTGGMDLYAANSRRIGHVRKNLPEILAKGYDTVLVLVGNNDVMNEKAVHEYIGRNTKAMVEMAHKRGTKIVLATIAPVRDKAYRDGLTVKVARMEDGAQVVEEMHIGDIVKANVAESNKLIRAAGADAFVDVYEIMEDPEHPHDMNPALSKKSLSHPSLETGWPALAKGFYDALVGLGKTPHGTRPY